MTQTRDTAKPRYLEVATRRVAHRELGRGAPLVLFTRFGTTMDNSDPAFGGVWTGGSWRWPPIHHRPLNAALRDRVGRMVDRAHFYPHDVRD